MSQKRIIFAGTGAFAVPALKALSAWGHVVAVITQPQKPAGRGLKHKPTAIHATAEALHLPVLTPHSLKRADFESVIQEFPCDFLIVASYGKIIPSWMLEWPNQASVNIHGSLLPRWRGASPIQHALQYGDTITGVCIMAMTNGLDEGPVYLEKKIIIEPHETQESLCEKLSHLGADALLDVLNNFDNITPVAQQGTPSYAPKIQKEHGKVDWSNTAQTIINQFRALTPWPGLYSFDSFGTRVKLNQIALLPIKSEKIAPPGHIEVVGSKVLIHTSSDCIELLAFQYDGKKSILCAEALKTRHSFLSETFFLK
jgi:methionyl-tRNA formyltransferase